MDYAGHNGVKTDYWYRTGLSDLVQLVISELNICAYFRIVVEKFLRTGSPKLTDEGI